MIFVFGFLFSDPCHDCISACKWVKMFQGEGLYFKILFLVYIYKKKIIPLQLFARFLTIRKFLHKARSVALNYASRYKKNFSENFKMECHRFESPWTVLLYFVILGTAGVFYCVDSPMSGK